MQLIKMSQLMRLSSFHSLDLANIDSNGSVLERGNSNGTPDTFVPKRDSYEVDPSVNLFKEYKFTVDDLVSFRSFRIKVIGTSTDQAVAPMIRNLRGIAQA